MFSPDLSCTGMGGPGGPAGMDLGFIKGGGLIQGTNLLGRGSEAHFPACKACWN